MDSVIQEQRLVNRLVKYWDGLCKDRLSPEFAQFNVSSIDDISPQCVLFEIQPIVDGKPSAVRFMWVGDKVRALYGQDMTGNIVHPGQKHLHGATLVRKLDEIIAMPMPIFDSGQFVNDRSKIVKYRTCLLPFSNHSGQVTHILAGLSWKEF